MPPVGGTTHGGQTEGTKVRVRTEPYLYILPCLTLVVVIIFYPVVVGVINSFRDINLIVSTPPRFVGISNFVRLFHDHMFWSSLKKSCIWTGSIVVVTMIAGFGIAILLNQNIQGKRIFRGLILIPWVTPAAIGGVIWKWIYAEQYGLLNFLLKRLGFIAAYQPWLSVPHTAFWAVTLVAIWKGTPFVAITFLAGLQAIPPYLYEAAKVDGANSWQLLRWITIPQLKGLALIVALLTAIWNFNQFEIIQVITRGGPGDATSTLPVFTYKLFSQAFQVSYASSVAVVMLVIMSFLAYFYIKRLLLSE